MPSPLDPLVPLLRTLTHPSRRRFLTLSVWAAAGLGCRRPSATVAAGADAAAAATPPAGKILDATEWRTLEAATSRILPSDEGPGAREARAIAFLDGQLATPALAPAVQAIRALARLLDELARRRHGQPFAESPPEAQDALLSALAAGKLPVARFPQREVFKVLHTLTLEGFLCDPRHGGNAGEVGWRAIGFAAPHLRFPGDPNHHHGR